MKRKMKGKKFAILVSLAMVFTMIPIMGTSVYADDPHANFTPKYLAKITLGSFESIWATQFYPPISYFYDHETGETIVNNPAELKEVNGVIEISHPGQLVRLAESVNSGTDYTGKTIKLISDISLQTPFDTEIAPTILEDTSDPITHGDFGITLSNRGYCKWPSPIGSNEHPFKGTFDGQGHKITQMGVFNDGENDLFSGLFGVTENAVIKNLNITGHFVLAKATGENQNSYAGALAGRCKNTRIENVHASCNIFNHALKGDAYSGGLVGYMADNSTAINSSSSGDIYNTCGEGSDSTAGGLFGRAADFDSTRKILAANCFASGNVYASSGRKIDAFVLAGGLVGTTGLCRINNCYATGNVSAYHTDSSTGSCTQGPAAGGLVGNNNCDINNSYATGNVYSGTKTEGRASCCAGGLSGYIQNGTFTNCYTTIANDSESGRVIEVKTRGKENQVKNFDYSNWGIQERAKSDFSDGTVASLLNGEGGNVWTTENGKTVLRDNPGYSTPQDAWGTKITENGATYYVADDGKTSAMVKAGEIVWLKEESGGTSAWYGLDNSENLIEEGSRFWVKKINKEEDPSEWEKYYAKLDQKYKEQAVKEWIFICGVVRSDGQMYEITDSSVNLYVETGKEWNYDDTTGVYIGETSNEPVDLSFTERTGNPEREGTYTRLELKHFGSHAMISNKGKLKLTPNDRGYTYNGKAQGPGSKTYNTAAEIKKHVKAEGLLPGHRVKSVTVGGQRKDVGTSDLKVTGCLIVNSDNENVNDDYDITFEKGRLIIKKAKITIKADDKTCRDLDRTGPLTWTVTDGKWYEFKAPDIAFDVVDDEGTSVDPKTAPEGKYTIIPSWKTKNRNYEAIFKEGTFDTTHNWDDGVVTKKATTTATGTKTFTCEACKETRTETIPKLAKKANPLKVKGKTTSVKYKKLKKKTQTLKVSKVIKFTKKGQGRMSYKKSSVTYTKAKSVKMSKKALKKYKKKVAKKIKINTKTGKVTVKKGLKKGTYKVKAKVRAAGNANYKASGLKTVTFKIKLK